jgi:hypothetical protein
MIELQMGQTPMHLHAFICHRLGARCTLEQEEAYGRVDGGTASLTCLPKIGHEKVESEPEGDGR